MKPSSCKLCIFDLDGTLVDSLTDLAVSVNYALEQNGFTTHPTDSYRTFVGDGVFLLIERALFGQAYSKQAYDKVKADYDAYYQMHCMDVTAPYPGVMHLLDSMRAASIAMAIVSNKPDAFVQQMVRQLGLTGYFVSVCGHRPGIAKKPDPQALLAVAAQQGVKAEQCLYVGDSDVDIITGKNAGIFTIGVAWGFRGAAELRAAGAHKIVQTPGEILAYLGLES